MSVQIDRINGVDSGLALKAPVRVATTANITLSGEQSIDGVAVLDGDRVLVKNQTTSADNGIYDASTSDWTRSKDFDSARDAVTGTRVSVVLGTVGAGREYRITTADYVIGNSATWELVLFESSANATAAAASAAAALASQTAAATSATTATTQASAASSSSSSASTSASTATTQATAASASATAAAASAVTAALQAASLTATSTTSLLIAVASKTFTTQTGKLFAAGIPVIITSNANPTVNYMFGTTTSYSGTTLIVNVTAIGGSGTLADWTITVAGLQGPQGIQGAAGAGTGDMLRANNLSDLVSAATSRTNLGLGTAATQATGVFAQVANNLSDLANAGTARTNLGVAIGTNVQAWDTDLDQIAGLTYAADTMSYFTGAHAAATTPLTSAGRALIDDADAAAQRTTLGLGTAAVKNTGTTNGTIPVLDSVGLPAVDGSQLLNLPASAGYSTDLSSNVRIFDDFFYTSSSIFSATVAGTNAAAATLTDNSLSYSSMGVVDFTTGTTSTGSVYTNISSGSAVAIILANGAIDYSWRIRTPIVGTSAQRFILRAGIYTAGSATPSDGVYFRLIDNVNSGNWQCVCVASSTETVINTSIAGSTSFVLLRATINAAATSVTFYIDGASQGTTTTNIPASVAVPLGVGLTKSVGSTARHLYVDYLNCTMTRI